MPKSCILLIFMRELIVKISHESTDHVFIIPNPYSLGIMSNKPKFCGKCGSSLKDNVKFCTNCGTEINSDVKIQRTTRDEFLNKYYGTKILDHINEIIQANIGDKQRLEAI